MGRRKIEIKAIKDDRNRSVTFLKRKGGLFKKAHELSVLCSVDVAVIIFGNNKKLYEYSSSDIGEILQRYNYYGQPNEHKGPSDFSGKKDDDDDDDDEMGSPPSHHSQEPAILPPQYQHQPGFQNVRHQTPSASPPVPTHNGLGYNIQRQNTPQPHMGSRPASRNALQRTGSNLGPQHMSGPPPPNGYAYMPQPAMYAQQNGPGMPPQHGHPPQMQHGGPMQHSPMPPASMAQMQGPPPSFQYPGPPQISQHPQQQHLQPQQYLEEQRRSMPPAFPQQERIVQASPQPPPQQLPRQPSPQPPPQEEPQPPPSREAMLQPVKRMSKSRSIFTPIDESRSILSQHWASSTSISAEPASITAGRAQSVDVGSVARQNGVTPPVPPPQRSQTHDKNRNASLPSTSSSVPDTTFTPPSRTNSAQLGAKRPRLKVQIPDEPSPSETNTGGSSPPGSTATGTRQTGTDGSHSSGVVLPPPSPATGAILSAGASGPVNPFARPLPPSQNSQSQSDRKDNIETPVSALPSRFMSNEFLPSPSSFFYPEWNLRGNESNTLPSPMNFATPVMGFGASFLREDSTGAAAGGAGSAVKRKSPDVEGEEGETKRLKVEG